MKMLSKKEKKKLGYLGIIIVLHVLVIVLPIPAQAWKNGVAAAPNDPRPSRAYAPEVFMQDYESFAFHYYGTHDFIAEMAWDLTVASWKTEDGKDFHNERRFACFMLGTEVPDYAISFWRHLIIQVDHNCGGVSVSNKLGGMSTNHQAYIDPLTGDWYTSCVSSDRFYKMAAVHAEDVMYRVLYHLAMGHCEAASYYMGAMMHFIADAGSYGHTSQTYRVHHSSYEAYVNSWTGSPYWWNAAFRPDFYLDIEENHPFEATYKLAKRTFYGNGWASLIQDHGAAWMDSNFEADWHNDAQTPAFRDCVERDLNNAIYYCASALVFIKNLIGDDLYCNCNPLTQDEWITMWDRRESILEELALLLGYDIIGKLTAMLSIMVATKEEEEIILMA